MVLSCRRLTSMLARDRAPNHRFTPPGDLHGSGGYGNDKLVGGADVDLCRATRTDTLVSCEQLSLY
jgi:hypothetical protein